LSRKPAIESRRLAGAVDDPFQTTGLYLGHQHVAGAQDASIDLDAAGAKQQAIFLLACVPERRLS
jgi:hypothetical protein